MGAGWGIMTKAELPVLRCESRRRHVLERGLGKWTFAVLVVASALGDGVVGAWEEAREEEKAEEREGGGAARETTARGGVVPVCEGGLCAASAEELAGIVKRARRAQLVVEVGKREARAAGGEEAGFGVVGRDEAMAR